VAAFALPARADISFFGTARVIPTYFNNFDFDDNKSDAPSLTEAGWASGEFVRGEFRLGWKAGGDNWKVMMIAESDVIYEKDTADRSFYGGAEKDGQTNTGGEFGIERIELSYTFSPALVLSSGWNIRAADIYGGGLLYGDDHPFIEIAGKLSQNLGYALTYITVQNRDIIGVPDATIRNDWRVYLLKFNVDVGAGDTKGTLSPILLFSDNRGVNVGPNGDGAQIFYYGLEGRGQIGIFKPSFEFIIADGEFRNSSLDISAYAAFAGVEAEISKTFKPYIAFRYASGDDNSSDNDVEGFVGVTDIGRFTPLMGMDGNILGGHLASGASPYNSPLYSYSPDRAVGGNFYGGIGNGSSGNNPGQMLFALGAKGAISEPLSYKAQVFMIWYDQTGNLPVGAGKTMSEVDDYAGTTFDLQLKYVFSKNFAADFIYSTFVPGDGIKDQLPTTADDTIAQLGMLTLAWTC